MTDWKLPEGSLYDQYTWPEIRDLPKRDRVAMIPVGAVEEHGHHLPINTDNFLLESICSEATRCAPDDILLLPLVPYGACETTSDYPGTISISADILINYVYDIVKSVARHGFAMVLIVNGHGGNRVALDLVARKVNAELGIACGAVTYWNLITREIQEFRSSEPGGVCHACEMETSFYLHLDSSKVQMEKTVKDMGYPVTKFFSLDFAKPGITSYVPIFSKFSQTGVVGDPTVATAEKGKKWLNSAAERLVELVKEFKKVASERKTDCGI